MKPYFLRSAIARIRFAVAMKASRHQTWSDNLAHRVVERVQRFEFDLDEMVNSDQGYDPDELERYQRGEPQATLPSTKLLNNADHTDIPELATGRNNHGRMGMLQSRRRHLLPRTRTRLRNIFSKRLLPWLRR